MPRSSWKNQFFLFESASKFHNRVRDIFTTDDFFKQLHCYQEVLVKDLVPTYPNSRDCIDWYIDEYSVIIELHGIQHYKMQSFGSSDSYWNQMKAHNNIKYRDDRKKTALVASNFIFLEIPYQEFSKLNSEYLKHKIFYES
jgi:hypothetical protein